MSRQIVLHVTSRRLLAGLSALSALLFLGAAAAPRGAEAIRVRHIEVVDAAGHTLVSIGPTEDGRCGVYVMDAEGSVRAALQLRPREEDAGVAVFGKDRSNFVALTARSIASDPGSALTVASSFGNTIVASSPAAGLGLFGQRAAPQKGQVTLGVLSTGDAGLDIIDDRGRERGTSPDGDR